MQVSVFFFSRNLFAPAISTIICHCEKFLSIFPPDFYLPEKNASTPTLSNIFHARLNPFLDNVHQIYNRS